MKIIPLRYQALIGVGGVGAGQFFALNGNHTLGREESRSGHFLDRRDYCKLHIIAHYVKTFLGSEFHAFPLSRIGTDAAGQRLRLEMEEAGLDLRYLTQDPDRPTLYSLCFVYPDGSGGNLTVDDSAADAVQVQDLAAAEPEFTCFAGRGIALAAPETPLAVRLALLHMGLRHQFFCVAALTTAETKDPYATEILHQAHLVALNLEEAASLAGVESANLEPLQIVEPAIEALRVLNPRLLVSITAGPGGSWSWDGTVLQHVPAYAVPVISTAGAGDAHLAGMLAGLTWNLGLAHAQELGTLVAAQSVTSPHTIHPGIRSPGLLAFTRQIHAPLSQTVYDVLTELARPDSSGGV
jgi:ribokinase